MISSFTARPVTFIAPNGYRPMNPSVTRFGNRIVMVQRIVNYEISSDGNYISPVGFIHTRNFLLELNQDLGTRTVKEILPPLDIPKPLFPQVVGFEDLRLFEWSGQLWTIGTVRDLNQSGWCEQVLARIDYSAPEACRLTDWRILRPSGPQRHEKNWMPRVVDNELEFIYSCDPVRVLDHNAQQIIEVASPIAATNFRGGSQAIEFDGGWLMLVHIVETPQDYAHRQYWHRLVWLNAESILQRVSKPFFFQRIGIEFSNGLCWHPDGKRLVMSFGVGDAASWVATIDADQIRTALDT